MSQANHVLRYGGGIRGLVSLLILQQLLRFVRDEEVERDRKMEYEGHSAPRAGEHDEEIPLACHYWNFMFGTSTGGIIAIMLGRLRMSIADCIATYRNLGSEIFAKRQTFHFLGQNKYDYGKLEQIIQDVVRRHGGDDLPLSDSGVLNKGHPDKQERVRNRLVPCRVGVFAVQSDTQGGMDEKIHLFRSYYNSAPPGNRELDDPTINLRQQLDAPIWRIARATSAAPTYFRSIEVKGLRFIDGGLLANNPSQLARAEVNSMHQHHPSGGCRTSDGGIRFLVSLGTGRQAEQLITRGAGPIPKLLSIVRRALKEMTNPEPVHQDLKRVLDPKIYHRFNVEKGLKNMKLDECKVLKDGQKSHNLTFSKIEEAVKDYLGEDDVWKRLKDLARQLVDHRRERRRPGYEWFRGLSIPGPLLNPIDDAFRSEDTSNGATNVNRRGSLPEPLNRAVEMPTTIPEMPTGLMISELQPNSPIQDLTRSLPTSPTYMPFDSVMTPQEEWCLPTSHVLEYHTPN
ncbi:FabD/lysophospholipase-like protein [Aureobasidium pullulans]|uniref:FabD/lysophospholipase-like protein n=1 Tax=Aureobasidium pullulans TaxID=5580 RepID=A0A4S9WR33_AURPU|nr:FabD/lysophospholipase-like protein [Aureobasidium pullulans]THZ48233.1 FabD/lysophospholipase-like protein [Aureobasidium pullulans]THZ68247.1 FabD/lysophospholipase-like protein [Aureobasidium pullulans]THZ90406.1 FabD/lysophospholipase-like protein [Aureobasidium pullulans]